MTLLVLTSEPGAAPPTEVPYETSISLPQDDALLINGMTVTDGLGATYTYSDATSIAKYGSYFSSLTSLTSSPNEGYDQAVWRVTTQKTVLTRVDQITINPVQTSSPGDFAALLPTSPGWAFESATCTVNRRPQSGNSISINCFVERVSHSFDGASWSTTLGLSNSAQVVNATATWLVLGNATTGKLGTGVLGR